MTYLFFAGLASVTAGVALIYPPAALIVGGALASAVAYRLGDA
jgi:hypothetical protein